MILVDEATLERLRVKYEALVELRQEREESEARGVLSLEGESKVWRRQRMRRVAREFPGSLRELEAFDVSELRGRLDRLNDRIASGGGPNSDGTPDWIEVIVGFHSLLRCILGVKSEVRSEKGLTPSRWVRVLETLCAESGSLTKGDLIWLRQVDVSTINRYLDPPGRHLLNAIWEELSCQFGVSVGELKSIVFEGD